MRKKSAEPKSYLPPNMKETVRQKIISSIKGKTLSVREISTTVRASEKEVYNHLSHIQKTVHTSRLTFIVSPAECRKCGFSFAKRARLTRPGKCPLCRSETISGPFFSITE